MNNQLVDVRRGEYQRAEWFYDESTNLSVEVDSEVSEPRFNRFMELRSLIQQVQMDVKMRYLAIACALLEIERDKLYLYVAPKDKKVGYSTFYGFCQDVFGFKKTTTKNMVAVAREYCGPDGRVKLEYLNFSFTQLVEMLPIEEKYRMRISVKCSTRDIRRLNAYYKNNVPKADGTVEDDLAEWNKICKQEHDRKLAKKNAITFRASKKEEKSEKVSKTSESEFDDDEDERDIVTPPTEKKKIPFETLKKGLFRQLDLLKENYPEWSGFSVTVMGLVSRNSPAQTNYITEPLGGKLYLKNQKERKEWLENYRSWGVWLDLPDVSKRFYRYNFKNGTSMIVEEYLQFFSYCAAPQESRKYSVIDQEHPNYAEGVLGGMSGAVDWLTKHAKEL